MKLEIYEQFKISIFRPKDIIFQLEDLRRELDYQPVRLAGTTELYQELIKLGEIDLLTDFFAQNYEETKAKFQQKIRRFLAEPDKFECWVVRDNQNKLLALWVYGKLKKHQLEIPILRLGNNALSATLARHLIFKFISRSAREGYQFTIITDDYLDEYVITAIQEETFYRANNEFIKPNLAVGETASELGKRLVKIGSTLGREYTFLIQIAENLNTENILTDVQTLALTERFLWPAKIIDAEIPNFIIPIQPRWAADLFDEKLANQTILGRNSELAFNREAVYYKSVTNSQQLKDPARILWYVSKTQKAGKGKGFYEIPSVRACSYIDEVVIGSPEELYQKFQRLGVYKLSDISNLKRKHGKIMAIKFSHTELFETPVSRQQLENILNKFSGQCPVKVSPEVFTKVYNLGLGCLD